MSVREPLWPRIPFAHDRIDALRARGWVLREVGIALRIAPGLDLVAWLVPSGERCRAIALTLCDAEGARDTVPDTGQYRVSSAPPEALAAARADLQLLIEGATADSDDASRQEVDRWLVAVKPRVERVGRMLAEGAPNIILESTYQGCGFALARLVGLGADLAIEADGSALRVTIQGAAPISAECGSRAAAAAARAALTRAAFSTVEGPDAPVRPVPEIPRAQAVPRYLWDLSVPPPNPALTDAALAAAEAALGVKLPATLVGLLRERNGGPVRLKSMDREISPFRGIGGEHGIYAPTRGLVVLYEQAGRSLALDYRERGLDAEPLVVWIRYRSEPVAALSFDAFLDTLSLDDENSSTRGLVTGESLEVVADRLGKALGIEFERCDGRYEGMFGGASLELAPNDARMPEVPAVDAVLTNKRRRAEEEVLEACQRLGWTVWTMHGPI